MVRTMDEINAERRRMGSRSLVREEFRYEREAYKADTAANALLVEMNQIKAMADRLLGIQERLGFKARGLFTGSQVGDAQTSEAELVSAPLRLRIAELEGELETYRKHHVCTASCQPNAHVAFTGKGLVAELETKLGMYKARVAELDERLARSEDWVRGLREERDRALENGRRADHDNIVAQRARIEELEGRISNMSGWLDVKNGELASANAQRDAARTRVAELESEVASLNGAYEMARQRASNAETSETSANAQRDAARAELAEVRREELAGMVLRRDEVNATLRAELAEAKQSLAARDSLLTQATQERQQAVDANRELIERGVAGVKVRDKVARLEKELADVRQSLAARDSLLSRATQERDDYRTQLIEIRNVVLSDPIERALRPSNNPARNAALLAEALVDIRSTVSVPDHGQPVVIDIQKPGPPSPLGPPDTE